MRGRGDRIWGRVWWEIAARESGERGKGKGNGFSTGGQLGFGCWIFTGREESRGHFIRGMGAGETEGKQEPDVILWLSRKSGTCHQGKGENGDGR